MNNNDELQAARLFEQFLSETARGQKPVIDEFLNACPSSERDKLGMAVRGAMGLSSNHPHLLISEGKVAIVQQAIENAQSGSEIENEVAECVASIATAGRLTLETIKELASSILSISDWGPQTPEELDRAMAPALMYRGIPQGTLDTVKRGKKVIGTRRAKREAKQLTSSIGPLDKPTDVETAGKWLGAIVVSEPMEGVDGCIAMDDTHAIIFVNSLVTHAGRRRFTIAHELGHLVLHRDVLRFRPEVLEDIEHPGSGKAEIEANTFASELLMPEELVVGDIREDEPCLELAEAIAEEYDVSLTAAAVRMVELNDYRCALVFSQDGKIQWFIKSYLFPHYIPSATRLDPRTEAYTISIGRQAEHDFVEVPLVAWTDTDAGDVIEQSWPSFSGSVLTLLVLSGD